jgi:hypothetical protein
MLGCLQKNGVVMNCLISWIEGHQGLAAWVQAIFSVIAILAAWLTTRHQLLKQENIRRASESATDAKLAEACLALATDTCTVLQDIARKFQRQTQRRTTIGTERLEDIQFSLRVLAGKDLPVRLYVQMLPLQREVAYTLTAVRQQNDATGEPSQARIAKAKRRAQVASEAKEEISLTRARMMSDAATLSILTPASQSRAHVRRSRPASDRDKGDMSGVTPSSSTRS